MDSSGVGIGPVGGGDRDAEGGQLHTRAHAGPVDQSGRPVGDGGQPGRGVGPAANQVGSRGVGDSAELGRVAPAQKLPPAPVRTTGRSSRPPAGP